MMFEMDAVPPVLLAAAGVVLVLVLLVIWRVARRRRSVEVTPPAHAIAAAAPKLAAGANSGTPLKPAPAAPIEQTAKGKPLSYAAIAVTNAKAASPRSASAGITEPTPRIDYTGMATDVGPGASYTAIAVAAAAASRRHDGSVRA